ncbi:MAG: 50S ribosomal protein L23 [Candidatus Pacebacteria bacterium]|nr:50S ribosomal protein L23 [Candidatus Paceibacterota bacterium]
MAIFGDKKKEKEEGKIAVTRKHRARTTKLAEGMAHEIVSAPWFSEKALIGTEKGVYAFAVPSRATKASIASAIKEIYNVEPRKVHIVNLPAKKKMMRTKRGVGVRVARRKAYVYLNTGDTLQFA